MSHPSPIEIVPLATRNWEAEKTRTQHFYGHSYTAPTPKEYILQKLGLCISNYIAIHIRDAKLGSLVPPTHPHKKDYTYHPRGNCVGADSHNSRVFPSLHSDFGDATSWRSPNAVPPNLILPSRPPSQHDSN